MSVKLSVTGLKEIDDVLRGMPLQLQDRVLKTAHADAAKPLIDTAQSIVPVGDTHNLEKSIGVERINIKRVDGIGVVQVGPRRRGGFKGFHGHFIEFSKTNRDGTKSKKFPFMEPAFNLTKAIIEKRIVESVGKKLAAFMKRTIKNG